MEMPLQAEVECTDGVCGSSEYVLINPVIEKVTHLVVKEDSAPHMEYIVSIDLVSATIAGAIQLRCSKAELEKMDPFVQMKFIKEQVPNNSGFHGYGIGTYYYFPYVRPELTTEYKPENDQQIPGGRSRYAVGHT